MIGRARVGAAARFGGNPDGEPCTLIVKFLDRQPTRFHACGTMLVAVNCMERLWKASERAGRSLSVTLMAIGSRGRKQAENLCRERGLVVT